MTVSPTAGRTPAQPISKEAVPPAQRKTPTAIAGGGPSARAAAESLNR